jgi:hypothetical protein
MLANEVILNDLNILNTHLIIIEYTMVTGILILIDDFMSLFNQHNLKFDWISMYFYIFF